LQILQTEFILTDEGSIATYLGIDVQCTPEGHYHLRQPHSIESLVNDFESSYPGKLHPCREPALPNERLEKSGPPREHTWSYPSYIGRLNYIAGTTRPDIAFAVHQCARFSADPRKPHEDAVKKIVRYLKGTHDKGIIFKPDRTLGLQCYVDASFASGWTIHCDADDPSNVYSRTGFVLRLFGCPLLWVSKLQTEVTLSTCESEYVALSQSLRDVIVLINIMTDLTHHLTFTFPIPDVSCTVFEDNAGALELANAPKIRPRTRHIALKYHHFREHVKQGTIIIKPVDTASQIADMFTKGLPHELFTKHRLRLMGW
jgi:hypothetical protein